jgi:hypothetical protein
MTFGCTVSVSHHVQEKIFFQVNEVYVELKTLDAVFFLLVENIAVDQEIHNLYGSVFQVI